MKVTNGEIFDIRKPLSELATQKMPVQTSMAVLKLRELIKPAATLVEEMRTKLIQEYGDEGPEGMSVKPTILIPDPEHEGRLIEAVNPKWEPFVKDFEEVRAVEVELDFQPIHLRSNVELSPAALMTLEKFVEV
ncbi:hypothetical protein LCGC14_2063870 [marine sediment metagenome]|uniref:Uncharacterized protein n=1 Tax=marine sediment metagenome TaxID=412755 RepID=A0A0F9GYV1_9ZZZZ